MISSWVLCVLLTLQLLAGAPSRARRAGLVDVRAVDASIWVDLSYRRPQNAFGRQFYLSNVALLREPEAQRLARVHARLRRVGLGLLIWDAYRPHSVQWAMWRARPDPRYLASPWRGSNHNRGAAVDLTLVTASGRALPMPTPHDEFSPRAYRGARRGVSREARRNASQLARVMRAEGFRGIRNEWWHFDAPAARRYPLLDVPLPRR